jgi:hypothetical protein
MGNTTYTTLERTTTAISPLIADVGDKITLDTSECIFSNIWHQHKVARSATTIVGDPANR